MKNKRCTGKETAGENGFQSQGFLAQKFSIFVNCNLAYIVSLFQIFRGVIVSDDPAQGRNFKTAAKLTVEAA